MYNCRPEMLKKIKTSNAPVNKQTFASIDDILFIAIIIAINNTFMAFYWMHIYIERLDVIRLDNNYEL